ncbi:MAG: hypothetical protein IKK09_01630 [Clostridia bacterium]|nr:hypothetical protein [Clostridia bacterium]
MARMGRPPIFKDIDAFEERLNLFPGGFFAWCKEKNHMPLLEWFAVYMGCSSDAIQDYMKKDGMQPDGSYDAKQDFNRPLKLFIEELNAYLVEFGLTTKLKHDPLVIFCLKQRGYTDKQEVDTNMTVSVQLADNFKDLAN